VPALPSTKALLFTDIEGSTQLTASLGDAWPEVLHLHRVAGREGWQRHGGHEVDTAGDGFFVVFDAPGDGVAAAVDVQRTLTATTWPHQAEVRVRMGLHVGTVVEYDGSFVGYEVHRAARIAAAAHGGQVVASEPVVTALGAAPVPDVTTVDLGRHPLKDLADDEHLFQVCAPGLLTAFPPLRTDGADSAPVPATYLNPVDIAPARLSMPDGRLLTLTAYGARLGRASDNDVVLAEERVSRHHCSIGATDGGFILTDLHSTHGTFVNDVRVDAPQLLGDGDRIRIGRTEIGFAWPA
jgi:class 3 adenylate cyclase